MRPDSRISQRGPACGHGSSITPHTDRPSPQRTLAAVGDALPPGDFILAGSTAHAPTAPGDRVSVEIDGLDRVDVTIAR